MSSKGKSNTGQAKVVRARQRSSALAWRLPPLAWISGACRAFLPTDPKRILVCGASSEAILLAKSFPQADVVVTDASSKNVRALRLSARRRRLGNIVVEEAVPTQPALAEITGRNFDLILALDLSSPQAPESLSNLASCASRQNATIFCKTPAAAHPFLRLGEILPSFGLDLENLPEDHATITSLLPLLAALGGDDLPGNAALPVWSFKQWIDSAKSHGLHFAASGHVPTVLARSLQAGGVQPLLSFGRESLAILFDSIARPVCHQMVFTTSETQDPPWRNPEELSKWRPLVQFLPRKSLPEQCAPYNRTMSADISLKNVLPSMNMQMSAYLLELLRRADGAISLSEFMRSIPHEVKIEELVPALYFFFHSTILNLLPPTES